MLFNRLGDYTMAGASNETPYLKAIIDIARKFNNQLQGKEEREEAEKKIMSMLNDCTN